MSSVAPPVSRVANGSAAKATEHTDALLRAIRAHFQAKTEVSFDLGARNAAAPSVASLADTARRERQEAAKRAVAEHPIVRAAIEHLGAEIRDIRVPVTE